MKALRKEKSEAIKMRREGASYSQITQRVSVSKSTLSLWLRDLPLSTERINALRGHNAVRIERFQNTMRRKREGRWAEVRNRAAEDVSVLSKRELLIAGIFLYWGEGTKTAQASTSLSNTDPAMIRFFIAWLELLGVPRSRLKVYVHLYSDMDVRKELRYWSKTLGLPLTSFRKPYVKKSKRSGLSYKQKFSHGTCNLIYENRDVSEYVLMALDYIRSGFVPGDSV